MKQLTNVTLVNGLSEIYQLFTLLYPELVSQVKEWHQWGAYTDISRGLVIQLHNNSKLLFSIQNSGEEEGWIVPGCYMVPSYVTDIPESAAGSSPAVNLVSADSPEKILDIFCRMFPDYRSEIISFKTWRRFNTRFRGIMIGLRDRKKVLFSAKKHGGQWDADYPILVPSPDEDDVPTTEIERIIMSDLVIILQQDGGTD